MVRLKEILLKVSSILRKFQFQYGTIKSLFSSKNISLDLSFNSNMVRLKVAPNLPFYLQPLFQFQYGTIKRGASPSPIGWLDMFQFQYGTIKRC